MAAPLYLTKGELRQKLLTRLGYGGLGAAAGMFVPMADDLLEEAQEQLFQIFTDEHGVTEWPFTTNVGQRWYDIPETCDIDQINYLAAKQSAAASDEWYALTRGIGLEHDSIYEETEDVPYRYDIRLNEEDVTAYNLQQNGDFSQRDTSSIGAVGWSWGLSTFQITGGPTGVLTNVNPAGTGLPAASRIPVIIGQKYTIHYTIIGGDLDYVRFGGSLADDTGIPLSVATGSHTYHVTAGTTLGFEFKQKQTGSGVTIDNALVEIYGARQKKTQIEIWPKPDQAYPLKIEGTMVLKPFVSEDDRASFDSRLVLLYAVAFGKAHLNKPDAKSAMDAWTTRLKRIRSNQHGTRRYVRRNRNEPEREVRARPRVV